MPVPPEDKLAGDPRWALVQRVAASAVFERSKRLRDFLLFAGERAVRSPEKPLSEPEIRREVFGRTADADATEDTLVRVQASQLRRRLEHYFTVQGATEPVVIDLPRGTYMPVFRQRAGAATAAAATTRPALGPRLPSWAAAVVLALLVACVGLFVDARRWRARARGAVGTPVLGARVDHLWRQMFGQAPVYVVVADSNLTLLQDAAQYQLSLPEYQRRQFQAIAQERFPEAHRAWGWRLMNREYTSVADARLVQHIAAVRGAQGRGIDVVMARHADPSQFQSSSTILSGPRRANPWMELFERRLAFESHFDEKGRRAWFSNAAPQPGEPAEYEMQWGKTGYCRVAYLPGLSGPGKVLVISGLDMSSSDAGSEFLTNERRVQELEAALGIGPRDAVPHFELLLRTRILIGTASEGEIVTLRRLAP